MSTIAPSSSRTGGRIEDPYDHPIKLIDSTKPQAVEADTEPASRSSSKTRGLVKQITGLSVREELAKRKYAKWQQSRFDTDEVDIVEQQARGRHPDSNQALASASNGNRVQGTDFASTASPEQSREQSRVRGRSKERVEKDTKKTTKHEKEPYEVDILYENQRGSFFCGIPLYSHKSLLNLDPSPWVTREFKDSAVNITNAQVPDPSWRWSWKSWYVDMSDDVDEEGWQYSFSFSNRTSWHGTHPWFHSFVRRRRWLRKRVKRQPFLRSKAGAAEKAHMLTSDYFTIHAMRESSPGSTTGRESHISKISTLQDEEPIEAEIKNIPALTKALRKAAVDREKIDAVKNFIQNGGDDLHYLEEEIPGMMSQFVFQNSRRQLLTYLIHTVEETTASQYRGKQRESSPAATRRTENLERALKAAEEQVKNLEYWSDAKNVEKQELDSSEESEAFRMKILGSRDDPEKHKGDGGGDVAGDIRGISDNAEASVDRTRVAISSPPGQGGTQDNGDKNDTGTDVVGEREEKKPPDDD